MRNYCHQQSKTTMKISFIVRVFLVASGSCFAQAANYRLLELAISSRTKNTDLQHTRPFCVEFGKTFEIVKRGSLLSYGGGSLPNGGGSSGIGYAIDEKRSILLGVNLNDNWVTYLEL